MIFFWDIAPCSLLEFDLHFRGAYCLPSSWQFSETSTKFYQAVLRNIPEESHVHTRRRENLKSHIFRPFFVPEETVGYGVSSFKYWTKWGSAITESVKRVKYCVMPTLLKEFYLGSETIQWGLAQACTRPIVNV
jgi:hypothetical protein